MKLIELEFAELQTPLFLNGVNHGAKLNPAAKGVDLMFDLDTNELVVGFKGKIARIPAANVASKSPKDPSVDLAAITQMKKPVKQAAPAAAPQGKIKAQVSTPTSHVFEVPKS